MPYPGHGTLMHLQLPGADPGVYTTVAHMGGSIDIGFSYPKGDVTTHNLKMTDSTRGGALDRSDITSTLMFTFGEVTHDFTLENILGDTYVRIPTKITGPPDIDGDPTIEIIGTMWIQSWSNKNPVKEGISTVDITWCWTGDTTVNGVLYSQ